MANSDDKLMQRVSQALSEQYEMVRLLGKGGMASVFLAREHSLKRLVAIKVLDPGLSASEEFRTRFQREAETAAQLHHPGIVPIYRVGEAEGVVYFTMAYVDGESLAARLKRGRLPVDEALGIAREITAALAPAHRRGIIHRDIKPANVLFDQESDRAHVTDFGIAQLVSAEDAEPVSNDAEDLTVAGMVMGTPRYMSPEQAGGSRDLTPAADLYAVGIILYEMLTGAYPYAVGPNRNFLVAHLTQDATPMTSHVQALPHGIEHIVGRLLAKDPASRYQSADALLSDLGSGETRTVESPRRRWKGGRIALAGFALVIAAGIGRQLLRSPIAIPEGVEPRQSILLGFFNNTSADRALDWLNVGGVEMLGQSLARWEDMQVIGVDRLLDAARKADIAGDQPISRSDALEMARIAGVWTATTGSIVLLGRDSMRITVRVYDVATADELSTASVTVPRDAALTDAFDALGRELLEISGAPQTAVLEVEPPTRSIEAYRAYIDGMLARNRFNIDSARIAFRRAVDRDPQFALAYFALSSVSTDVEVPSRDPAFLALADSALFYSEGRPVKERLLIQAFHAFVNADMPRAQELYRELLDRDSTLVDAWAGLGAASMFDLTLRVDADGNEYWPSSTTVALRSVERALELDANDYRAYPILTTLLMGASQEEGRLPAFRDPPPGPLTTLSRRVPDRWYRILLVDDSIVTIPVDSVDARYTKAEQDSLRMVARERASQVLRQWVSRAPDQGFAWLTLGSMQHEDNQHDEAFNSLAEAHRAGLPSVVPYEVIRLAWLLEALRFNEALPLADSMAAAGWGADMSDDGLVQSMPFPNALLVRGRVEEAIALDRRRQELQSQFPSGPEIQARLELAPIMLEVRARAATGQLTPELLAMARDSIEAVAAGLDDSARARTQTDHARALLHGSAVLGDTSRLSAFRAQTDDSRYRSLDAWAAAQAGDMAKAADLYEAAVEGGVWTPMHVFPLAQTAEALGRHQEALEYFTAMDTLNYSAIEGTDTDFLLLVQSYALRAAIYDATGDHEAAKRYYQVFLNLWHDPEEGLRPRRDLARQGLGELERQDRSDN